jgi:hypothetical protein
LIDVTRIRRGLTVGCTGQADCNRPRKRRGAHNSFLEHPRPTSPLARKRAAPALGFNTLLRQLCMRVAATGKGYFLGNIVNSGIFTMFAVPICDVVGCNILSVDLRFVKNI